MNKRRKIIFACLIVFFCTCFVFQKNISAEYSGTGGTGSGSVGAAGDQGTWVSKFGFYIKVYNSNNKQKGNTVDVDIGSYTSSTLKGWITYDGEWHSNPEKLYDYLDIPYGNVSGDYSTLLSKINTTLSVGDYITIEPYTVINNKKYTFRQISDSTEKFNKCTEMKCTEYECAEYNKTCNKYECTEYKCATYKCATYNCATYKCATYECDKYKCIKKFLGICTKRSTTECEKRSTTKCQTYSSTCKTYSSTCKTYSSTCKTYSSTCAKSECSSYKNTSTCKTYSNTCKTHSTTECAKTKAYNYYVWYAKPAVILSNAAKVGSNITVGNKTFTAPTTSCTKSSYDSNFCGYKSNENVGYGITVVRYQDIYKNGKVKINIKRNDTKQLIVTKNATFRIYDSNNKKILDVTTTSGSVEHSLEQGTYKIEQITPPGAYKLASAKSVDITITANNVTEKDFLYDTTCQVKLGELGSSPSKEELLALYKSYSNNTNLLNFSNPSCSEATCDSDKWETSLGCLSGEKSLATTFNENNLSCHDDSITNAYGDYIGFCSNYFKLTNNLGASKFYGISGQFLIRQDNSILTIYNNNLDSVKINSQYVASSKSGKVCYILTGNTYDLSSKIKSNNVYFGNVDGDSQTDLLDSDVSTGLITKNNLGTFTKHTYELIYDYKFSKKIYLEKITGKYSSIKTNATTQTEMYGIFSKFNSGSGSIPFSITYDAKTYTSDKCEYETTKQLIKYDKRPGGNLELEFRPVDTNNPFVDRNTKINWCDENGNCNANNNRVLEHIINQNNSYNQTGDGPKYKITLTPSDIEIIRKYNKDHVYDNYNIYCDNNNQCSNSFLYDLKNGTLKKYENNKPKYTYGILSNVLE